MAYSTTRTSLGQFFNSLYHVLDTKSFIKEFSRHSENGDRYSMIEMIMQVEQASKLEIAQLFNSKNDRKAQEFYNGVQLNEEISGKKAITTQIDQLTKALFAVNSNTPLFYEIIMMRIRYWFTIGLYMKCYKDCDYAIQSLNAAIKFNVKFDNWEKYEAMCVTMKNQCIKLFGKMNIKESNINSTIKLPRIDRALNKKLKSCSDAVSLAYEPTRGRHLIATRNIKAGSVLIVDQPFAFSTDKQALSTNCLNCHVSLDLDENIKIPCHNCETVSYCSVKCGREAWENYHKYECVIFGNFMEDSIHMKDGQQRSHNLLAYRTTISKAIDKQLNTLDPEFLCYQDAKCEEAKKSLEVDVNTDTYDPLDYRTVYSLETHCDKTHPRINLARSIKAVYLAKCLVYTLTEIQPRTKETIGSREIILLAVAMMRHLQAIICNAYEIVENFRDQTTKTWEPRNVGGAIYTSVSLINHSCYPNIVRHTYPGGNVVVRSLRFIEKGSEILDCYGPHFISDALPNRQQCLKEIYNFICTCEPCKFDWKFPFPNEITFRCNFCGCAVDSIRSQCSSCSRKIDVKKLNHQLTKCVKNRTTAITRMFDGHYLEALPLLLEHSALVDKILLAPSLEAIKTQQSIIQCYNSLGNIAKKCIDVPVI